MLIRTTSTYKTKAVNSQGVVKENRVAKIISSPVMSNAT